MGVLALDVCLSLDQSLLNWGFSVALTVCVLSANFIFHHSLLSYLVTDCDDTLHKLGNLHNYELN